MEELKITFINKLKSGALILPTGLFRNIIVENSPQHSFMLPII